MLLHKQHVTFLTLACVMLRHLKRPLRLYARFLLVLAYGSRTIDSLELLPKSKANCFRIIYVN